MSEVLRVLFGRHVAIWFDRQFHPVALASIATSTGLAVLSPILTLLTTPYGVSDATIGLLMAVFSGAGLVVLPFLGALSDRYGRKLLLVWALLLFGLSGAGIGATNNFAIAVALRTLQGAAWAGIATMTVTLIGDWYQGDRGNAAQAFRVFTIQAAGTIVPILAVWLAAISWRTPFLIYLSALPIALFVSQVVTEPTNNTHVNEANYTTTLIEILRGNRVLAVVLSFLPRMLIRYGFLTFISALVIRGLAGNPALAGLMVSGAAGMKMVVASQIGRLSDGVDRYRLIAIGFIIAGGGMIGLGLTTSIPLMIVAAVCTGAGDGLLSPIQKGILVDLVSDEYRGGVVGIGIFFQNTGATLAPLLLGGLLLVLPIQEVFVTAGITNGIAGLLLVTYAARQSTPRQ